MWLLSTFLLYLSIIGIVKTTIDFFQHPVKSCHVGDVVENACNKCLCTSKTVFECTPLDCNNKITDSEEKEPLCVPNQLYVKNLITCICTKDGRWPHKSCKDTFQSLPPRNVIAHTCEPDTYIPIDCNVCRCGPDGKIPNDRCTRNVCEDDVKRRANMATNTVFSKCEDKYWYSLAPCQFCFCVNQNKLVCNTGNYYTRNLDLGSYKLNICGKDLIKEAIELIPDNQRSLRMASDLTNTSTNQIQKSLIDSKPHKVNRSQKVKANQKMAIEFVPVKNVKQKDPIQLSMSVNINNSIESDDMEKEPKDKEEKYKPRVAPTTNRVDVNDANNIEDPKTKEDDDDESIGIALDLDKTLTTETTAAKEVKNRHIDYEGETLKINIPKALNKVFKLALRKSMVTLSKKTKCTPGATTVHECNMCFCLKNNKKLCTGHKCTGGKKA